MPFIAITLVIAAALGGGATVASQNALPGEALWNFKVNVTENVRSAVSFSEEAKAEADIAAIEARLKETATLSAEGRMNTDVQAKIESNFNAHAEGVGERIAALEEKGQEDVAAKVAVRFQAAIARHATILAEAHADAEGETSAALQKMLGAVRLTLDNASELSASASAKADAKANGSTDTSANNSSGNSSVQGNASLNASGSASTSQGTTSGSVNGSGVVEIGL